MRIKTQFILTVVLFGFALAAIAFSAIITGQLVAKAMDQARLSSDIARAASELGYLSSDYLIYRESEQVSLWQERLASFSKQVTNLRADNQEQQILISNIQADTQRIKTSFDSIVNSSQGQAEPLDPAWIESSWRRMAADNRGLASEASGLAQLFSAEADRWRQANLVIIFIMLGIFSAFFLVNFLLVQRRMLASISKLQAGTEIKGSDNIDFQLEEKKNDEIGDLSRFFNRVTSDLRALTASKAGLEKEIQQRRKIEDALRESEALYRAFFENNVEAVFVTAPDDTIYAANPKACQVFGLTEEQCKSMGAMALLDTSDQRIKPALDERTHTGKFQGELNFKRSDGTIFPGEVSSTCFIDRTNQTRIVITLRDITARKKAEQELSRVNREMRAITECDQAMVKSTDELALLNDVCRIICQTAGYRMAWVGMVQQDAARSIKPVAWGGAEDGYLAGADITWADTERGRGPTGTAARTGKTHFFQDFKTDPAAAPWRDGALARGYRSSIALPLSAPSGTVFGVFTLYASEPDSFIPAEVELLEELAGDIAFGVLALREKEDRLKAENKLRETSDFLNNLLDSASAPIIVWDSDLHITRFNHAFERLTGLNASEVIGQSIQFLSPSESWEKSLDLIRRARLGEHWESEEIPILRKDGSVRIVLWNSATIYADDGITPFATIAQGQDITERKLSERVKDEFVGLVSHELKTPLTVLIGALSVATDERVPPDEAKQLLSDAVTSADELAAIVDNLLELSRHQSSRLKLLTKEADMKLIAQRVANNLGNRSTMHRLVVELPEDLPAVVIDPLRIERVLNNLVENAIKYSPHGGEVHIFSDVKDGQLIIGVRDNGIGIAPKDQSRLFQSFERIEAYDTYAIRGLGLGLRVCKILVEAHEGKIWLESEQGKGSTFFFSIPVSGN